MPGVVVETHGVGEVFTIYFNTQMAPLNDVQGAPGHGVCPGSGGIRRTPPASVWCGMHFPRSRRTSCRVGSPGPMIETLGLAYPRDLDRARQPDGGGRLSPRVQPGGGQFEKAHLPPGLRGPQGTAGTALDVDCRVTVASHANMHRLIRNNPRAVVIYAAWRPNADAYLTRFFPLRLHCGDRAKSRIPILRIIRQVDRLIEDARLEIDPGEAAQPVGAGAGQDHERHGRLSGDVHEPGVCPSRRMWTTAIRLLSSMALVSRNSRS
jgi:peptide/nickel transport system substrate-binding protein